MEFCEQFTRSITGWQCHIVMRHGRTPFGFFDEEEDLDDWITFDPFTLEVLTPPENVDNSDLFDDKLSLYSNLDVDENCG